jgi:hypothetical protein
MTKAPREVLLSREEMNELVSLTVQQQSALPFWKSAFARRGIKCPQGRVCCMIYMAPDLFRLEWHSAALGEKAIAAGRDYRAFAERKDREFAAKRAVSS